jgi:hypothetical protein
MTVAATCARPIATVQRSDFSTAHRTAKSKSLLIRQPGLHFSKSCTRFCLAHLREDNSDLQQPIVADSLVCALALKGLYDFPRTERRAL